MSDIAVRLEDDPRKGRYIAAVAGREGEAYIAFTHREEGIISADHTIAPDSLKGTGAAFARVEHLVADARARMRARRSIACSASPRCRTTQPTLRGRSFG